MNAFEIDARMRQALSNLFDEETGEINEEAEAELAELEIQREEKVDAWCFWLEEEDAEITALEQMIAKLDDKLASKKKRVQRSKEQLQNFLQGEKFKSATHTVYYRTNKYTHIMPEAEEHPEELLPAKYVSIVTTYKPMKKEMKKAIEDGETIPGVWIEEKTSMIIK